MQDKKPVQWHIFAGILFSVLGMCLLNYNALFPDNQTKRTNNDDDDDDNKVY